MQIHLAVLKFSMEQQLLHSDFKVVLLLRSTRERLLEATLVCSTLTIYLPNINFAESVGDREEGH